MIAVPVLETLRLAARRRAVLDTLAVGLPAALGAGALAWRLAGVPGLLAASALALVVVACAALRRLKRFDRDWLIGQLDARVPGFEDSSALLLRSGGAPGGFAALQRVRLERRIAEARTLDLRPPWSRRAIAISVAVAVLPIAAALFQPEAHGPTSSTATSRPAARPAPGPLRIVSARLRVVPPPYTGLPAREQATLDVRAPEGSRLEWTLGIEPRPSSATLAFPDDGPVRLVRAGARWRGARVLDRPMLYRVEAPGLPRQRLSRLEAVKDVPPTVRVVQPEGQLVLAAPGQSRWTPVFEAADDYGVTEVASLRVTVTEGDGENITYRQRTLPLRGRGEARRKRYATTLDLGREGLPPGGDLIVHLVVSDNRRPQRQVVEGPSVILRRPAEVAEVEGLDGMAAKVMPAYFRSQRQIIIDAEALLAQRRRVAPDAFLDRSNGLGEDQAQLRLRYGQFMGEEAEGGGGGIALPTNDAPPATPASAEAAPPAAGHAEHDHAEEEPAPLMGAPVDALAEFGHAHDSGDAATLLDPGTRSTLSLALDAMWSSERALRQGRPDQALPFAYQALNYLKEAQQATRIFLGRTSSDLPPVDFSRRLTGEREGIVGEPLPPPTAKRADRVPAEAWRALEEQPRRSGAAPLRLDALEGWVRANAGRLSDPLALTAAIDTVRNEPGCLPCRRRLRALLWTALEPPAASVRRRESAGLRGRRYLDALR